MPPPNFTSKGLSPSIHGNTLSSYSCLEGDVVVTILPYSLFREYVAQLMSVEKKSLLIVSQNAITCKDVFGFFMR